VPRQPIQQIPRGIPEYSNSLLGLTTLSGHTHEKGFVRGFIAATAVERAGRAGPVEDAMAPLATQLMAVSSEPFFSFRFTLRFPMSLSKTMLTPFFAGSRFLALRPKIRPSGEAKDLGLRKQDGLDLLFDRDALAFYGDPAWHAKMASGKCTYSQKLVENEVVYTFTRTPNLGEKSFPPVNTNGSQRGWRPIMAFFLQRLNDIEVLLGNCFPTPASPAAGRPVLRSKAAKDEAGLEGVQSALISIPLGPEISQLALRTFAERAARRSRNCPHRRPERESQ
jgi:hypothetical protein